MQIICHGLRNEDFPVEFINHEISLGAEDSNGIAVHEEGISGCHAFLVEDGDDLFIRDNGSTGGTFLNHKKIQGRQKVSSGDIIGIGSRMIRVDFFPGRNVTLNFISTDQGKDNSIDATAVTMMTIASPVAPSAASDDDEVGHTMVAPSGTPSAASDDDEVGHTMVAPSGTPSAASDDDEVGHTMVAPESQDHPGVTASTIKIFVGGGEIGKYIIVKRIGKGGMGEVYLAKHKTLGTYRALKVLPKELMEDNAKFFERFIREAKLASEIRHPNVVGVMDVETDPSEGFPYIVMEYIDGGSLRDSLATNKKLSEEQAVVIVEAIASALRAAEEHKVVHRDIKPDNIMFTKQGEVKLADLGIAKNDDKDNDLTKTNMMIGTPAYLPPEQAQNAKGVDGRADIYSLGATFYEMLTGQHPYPGNNTIEILHKLFSDPVPDPRKVNPEVSPASAAIVMKMLAKNPKDRFQNAGELLEMMDKTFPPHTAYEAGELIKKVIAGECHNSTTFSSSISTAHFLLWRLKKPNKWLILSIVLLCACCILGLLFLFLGKSRSDKPETNPAPESGTVPVTTATAEPEPVRESLYELQIRTTPDAEIHFITQDGQMRMYSSDHEGLLTIPSLPASTYKVRISRNNYLPISRDFELTDNMTLDVPMTADLKKLVIKARPDSKISIAGVENGEKTVNASTDGSAVIEGLLGETVLIRIELPGWETYEQTLLLNKDMELQVPQKRIRVDLTVRTVPYAVVVLKQGDEEIQTFKANSLGVAFADGVPAGQYRLEVSGDGYHSAEMSCDLNRNQNLSVDLERITYELQINAEAETQIMLYLDHQLRGTYLVPDTGTLRLPAMPQGKYTLSAEKRGKTAQSYELNLDRDQTLDCYLADISVEVNPVGQTEEQPPVDNPPETQVTQQEQEPTPPEEISEVSEQQPPEPEKPVEGTILVYFLASTDVMNYVKENGLAISVGDQTWPNIREFPWSQSITAGKYAISVQCEGIEEMSIPQFTITAGQENECLLELNAKPSYVSFVSNMEDAIITFNNSTCKPGQEVECETFREFTAEGIFGDETISRTVRSSKPGDRLTVEFTFAEKADEPEETGNGQAAETGTGESGESGEEENPETGNEQAAETGNGEPEEAGAEQSKADLQYAEGMKLFADRKYKDALKVFTSAAEAGHKDAARKVGEINERGLGMWFSDSSEAIKWYRKAAALGDPESAGKVAKAIDEGDTKGTAKEMMDFYLQASVLKQPDVLYRISNLYKAGYKEIPQDTAKAIDYLKQAAELGDPDAMFDLGIRYEKGDGVVSNIQTALQWINKAADAGHDKAQRYRKQLRQ